MYLSFVWCVEGVDPDQAREEFSRILDEQREMYVSAWGLPVAVAMHQKGDTLIGHLYGDSGVLGWSSYVESNGNGLVWNGVCENFLGTKFGAQEVQDVLDALERSPKSVCGWDGNYFVISWSDAKNQVYLTTGATNCPTLWYTKGPRGWAAGSRGAPLLEMVGREKKVSVPACNIFLAYTYNYSNESLLEHVHRMPQRTQVVIDSSRGPRVSKYATLMDFINPAECSTDRNEILAACADRLITRIRKQIEYSSNPEVLVTGGRDSRCIAAAAKRAGYSGILSTGGAARSNDMLIGQKVAHRLKLPHRQTPDRVPMTQFSKAVDRLKLWAKMSEGAEVLRHVRAYNEFVAGGSPEAEKRQLFHGLCGEICRGPYYHDEEILARPSETDYSIGRSILLARADANVPLMSDARELLEERWSEFTQDVASDRVTVTQWLDLFYWQNVGLRWGGDMLSLKNSMYWVWTPYLDRELIRSYWNLDAVDKSSNRFIEDLTLVLARELEGLEYDHAVENKRALSKRLLSRLRRAPGVDCVKRFLLGNKGAGKEGNNEAMSELWQAVLLDVHKPFWANCIDEKTVHYLVHNQPASEVLWKVATIQLVSDVYS